MSMTETELELIGSYEACASRIDKYKDDLKQAGDLFVQIGQFLRGNTEKPDKVEVARERVSFHTRTKVLHVSKTDINLLKWGMISQTLEWLNEALLEERNLWNRMEQYPRLTKIINRSRYAQTR